MLCRLLRGCRRAATCTVAVILLAGIGAVTTPAAPTAPDARLTDEVRALWVARTSLTSPAAIAAMVQAARINHFNTVLVQVRARGDAYFAGGVEPRAALLASQPDGFDPLDTTLRLAHASGLRVHAWINLGLVSSAVDLTAPRGHVIHRHPEWLMVPRAIAGEMALLDSGSQLYLDKLARWVRSQPAELEGLYLSPIPSAAADYTVGVVSDLVARYAVDGVHLDYARYPNDEFDYSRDSLDAFARTMERELPEPEARRFAERAAADPFAYTDGFPERWNSYRRARLTALVARLGEAVRTWRPDAIVSAAVFPDAADAAARRLQDWQVWLADRAVDVVCPMAYATDTQAFTAQVTSARRSAGDRPLWAGIGAYRLSSSQTVENIRIARRLGATGVVLFSYDSLITAPFGPDSLAEIGQAAFAR